MKSIGFITLFLLFLQTAKAQSIKQSCDTCLKTQVLAKKQALDSSLSKQKEEFAKQIKSDITVLETDNVSLKGKFAMFLKAI